MRAAIWMATEGSWAAACVKPHAAVTASRIGLHPGAFTARAAVILSKVAMADWEATAAFRCMRNSRAIWVDSEMPLPVTRFVSAGRPSSSLTASRVSCVWRRTVDWVDERVVWWVVGWLLVLGVAGGF
jgi:hypothetical protein